MILCNKIKGRYLTVELEELYLGGTGCMVKGLSETVFISSSRDELNISSLKGIVFAINCKTRTAYKYLE